VGSATNTDIIINNSLAIVMSLYSQVLKVWADKRFDYAQSCLFKFNWVCSNPLRPKAGYSSLV